MKLQFFFKIFFALLFSFSSFANESIDTKVKKLTLELRCMTCQNQSIYDSDSDYSKDIKIFKSLALNNLDTSLINENNLGLQQVRYLATNNINSTRERRRDVHVVDICCIFYDRIISK